jgi:hypothetical protein
MDQMSEIMHFSVAIVIMGLSGTHFWTRPRHHTIMEMLQKNHDSSRSRNSQSKLLGHAEVFQEVDVSWQLLRLSCSVRGELVWNPSKMKLLSSSFS